jgi:hypothetical protein
VSTRRKAAPKPISLAQALDEAPVEQMEEQVLTVNGKPIPEEFAHAISYAMTDQGIAERANDGKPRARVEMVRDAYDKQLDEREAATEPWESEDPLKEAVDAVRKPGMGYRFLSPGVIAKRGMRKYKPVVAANGDPVTVGRMILGTMPIELQERRAKHYQDIGNDDLREAQQNLMVEQEQMSRDVKGIGPLRAGETLHDSGYEDASDDVYEIGVQRNRGRMAA